MDKYEQKLIQLGNEMKIKNSIKIVGLKIKATFLPSFVTKI